MTHYCFRIRFRLGDGVRLESDASEMVLAGEPAPGEETVVLRPVGQGEKLVDARQLVLRGGRFESEAEAITAANHWRGFVEAAFARWNIGADFGDRAAKSAFTEYGLQAASAEHGIRALNDVHGILVFECDPPPTFVSQELTAVLGKPADRVLAAATAARDLNVSLTPQQQLAYDLYSASFFQPSADARFAMLTMALETLLSPQPRSAEVMRHVEDLIAATQDSNLPAAEVSSIISSLRGLSSESIGQAGRRLARSLGGRRYMDEAAAQFFTRCYELRSRLVHGYYPRPSREEVDLRAAALEMFVGHLLSGELLDHVPD